MSDHTAKHFRLARIARYLKILGIAFLIGGFLFAWLGTVAGVMSADLGQEESYLSPLPGGSLPNLVFNPVTHFFGLALRINDVLSSNESVITYYHPKLRFNVRLDGISETPADPERESLVVQSPQGEKTWTLGGDQVLRDGDLQVEVGPRFPWQGLLHNLSGAPMVNVRVVTKTGASTTLLADDDWFADEIESLAIHFNWFADDSAARAALDDDTWKESASRRWGVREGDRLHAFTSFAPGTGIAIDDGREFTLAGTREHNGVPEILVVEDGPDGEHKHVVKANDNAPNDEISFDAWDLYATRLAITASQDGSAWIRAHGERATETFRAREGAAIRETDGLSVILEQVLAQALPIDNTGDTVYARTLTVNGENIALREGEIHPVGAYRLSYHYVPPHSEYVYNFAIVTAGNHVAESFQLQKDQTATWGKWSFMPTQSSDNQSATIRVIRTGERLPICLGALMLVLGLALGRYARWEGAKYGARFS